jgi:hypothetical protein
MSKEIRGAGQFGLTGCPFILLVSCPLILLVSCPLILLGDIRGDVPNFFCPQVLAGFPQANNPLSA